MSRQLGRAILVAGVVSLLAAGARGDEALRVADVQVGFAGKYKVGCWTPVRITLSGAKEPLTATIELTVPDGEGLPTRVDWGPMASVKLGPGEPATVTLYARFGRVRGRLVVSVLRSGTDEVLAERQIAADDLPDALLAGQELYVTLWRGDGDTSAAADPVGVLDAVPPGPNEEAAAHALVSQAEMLPDRWWGYEGVEALVMTTSRPELYADLTAAQLEALDLWVRQGGRLLISGGRHGPEILGQGGPLERFAPGTVRQATRLSRTGGLDQYVGGSARLDANYQQPGPFGYDVTLLTDVSGIVDVQETTGTDAAPLIVRQAHGFGDVVLATLDLDRPPFSTWEDRRRLVALLLGLPLGREIEDLHAEGLGRVTHLGYDDLVGQLRAALDQFQTVRFVPFSLVALLIGMYIALIGPVDYFLLRRVLGRMEWTWITFPLIVAAFCALAWFLAVRTKGDRVIVNQVDVVDVDVASSLVRGTTWVHVYSPRTQAMNLSLTPIEAWPRARSSYSSLLTWQGLPGSGLGGMNAAARWTLGQQSYRLVAEEGGEAGDVRLSISGLPMQVWSSRALAARWWSPAAAAWENNLWATRRDGELRGELKLVDDADIELEDCTLLFDRFAYLVGSIGPGQIVSLEGRGARNLHWLLTERRVEDLKDVSTPWNTADRDIDRIVQMLMLHEAAGGRQYTGLMHRYQDYLDLSHHLKLGRAMVIGKAARPATELIHGDAPLASDAGQRHTYYRFVLPVRVSEDN